MLNKSYTQDIQPEMERIKERWPWSLLKNSVSAELIHISIESQSLTNYIHFHSLPHYICVFVWIPENFALWDSFE